MAQMRSDVPAAKRMGAVMMRKGIKSGLEEVSNGRGVYGQGRYGEGEMVICKLGGQQVVFFCGGHEHLELGRTRDRHSVMSLRGGSWQAGGFFGDVIARWRRDPTGARQSERPRVH